MGDDLAGTGEEDAERPTLPGLLRQRCYGSTMIFGRDSPTASHRPPFFNT